MAENRIPNATIRRVWNETGLTIAERAAALGIGRGTLRLRAKALGLSVKERGGHVKIAKDDQFIRFWNAGVRSQDMADLFGVHLQTISITAVRLGLTARPHGFRPVRLADFVLREAFARDAAEWKRRQAELAERLAA